MPSDLPVDIVVRRLGGRARWSDLAVHTTRRRLDAALRRGEVVRLARGRYGLPDLPPSHAAASQACGIVSHLSAAEHHRLSLLLPPLDVHVTVRRNSHPSIAEHTKLHWRAPDPGDVRDGVTTVERTVLDCAADLPFVEALAVADQALALGLLSQAQLTRRALAWRGARRGAVRRVARHADGRAANPFESALRALAIEAGCTGFEPQVVIEAGGRVRVDLADRRRRIVLEADSFEWHGDRKALRRDCRRYDELVRAGWTVLRFSWEDVMFDPDWVIGIIRDVVRRVVPTGRNSRRVAEAPSTDVPGVPPRRAAQAADGHRQNSTVAKVPTRRKPTRS